MRARPPVPTRRAPGFTLVEIVVVLLIVSVLIAMAAVMTRGVVAAQKRSLTTTRMATVEAALLQFVAQQKRLPCPADGTLATDNNSAGVEGPRNDTAGCTGNQQNGVVPWRALALTEVEASDAWDRRLTFRVGPLLAAKDGMDMSQCDPAGNSLNNNATGTAFACAPSCVSTNLSACSTPTAFLTNNGGVSGKGLQVKNIAGAVLMNPNVSPHTGAAYVVISAGESGGGGYLSSGVLASSSSTGDGLEELKNYASNPFVSNAVTYYVDDSINTTAGNTHFDDLLLHPSVLMVATKAGLGPRTH